jgi:hypothetical protein
MSSVLTPIIMMLVTVFLFIVSSVFPTSAHAAWVNSTGTQFQVGSQLFSIVPTATGTAFVDPTCGSQGGTSLALVSGRKLNGVDAVQYPIVLVVSCLDNGGTAAVRSRLNFINPGDGKVIKQITTTAVPSNGWAHLVHRSDKGDLVGCGNDGVLYRIDFSKTTSAADGTATLLPQVATSCKGLAWDPDKDTLYQGLSVSGGSKIGRVISYKDGTSTILTDFTNLPCAANGMAISGGTLLMTCEGALTIHRLNKTTGAILGAHGTLTATGLTPLTSDPGLGDLACDPVSFHKDDAGNDTFTDAMWSRRGPNGNGVVALEFPASTCSMPASSLEVKNGVSFSPLAAGLSSGSATVPGQTPLGTCFANGLVVDADGDGLPDCWETAAGGVDFNGDGIKDIVLCVLVDTNGDGVPDTNECADPGFKDLFVYVDYMQFHKPDPQALSQTVSPSTVVNGVVTGVRSVREAFAAAPVADGIRLHMQVANAPVTLGGAVKHVDRVALTPCTDPADPLNASHADFDAIKAENFGTAAERGNALALNAKRLVFRYVLFAHLLVGNGAGTCNGSGAAEVGGDDAIVSLGNMVQTSVNEGGTLVTHNRGTRDQQAGTFMHELGHLLGLEHGGFETVNCKPNYLSVMNYPRQFSGSPISNRRLDYSRALLPDLSEGALNETLGLAGNDPVLNAVLNPILPYYPAADQTAFGPTAWSLTVATTKPLNWDRDKQSSETSAAANLNQGPTSGCDGAGTLLEGHDDWSNLLYRFTAAVDAAGGARTETPREMTKEDEEAFYAGRDADSNGVGDNVDCGGLVNANGTSAFSCTHRIDIKPSFAFPKTIKLGAEATVTVAIFSEKNGSQVWNAPQQLKIDDLANYPLTFSVDYFVTSVKVNNKGGGTCSESDVEDPVTLRKDGIKDFKCQFPVGGPTGPPPIGTNFGIVSGFFSDPLTGEIRAFTARQEVTIVP